MLKKIQELDNIALELIVKLRAPKFNKIMVIITNLGTNSAIWICFALPLFFFKEKRMIGFRTAAALALAALFGEAIIKPLVKRARPCESIPQTELLIKKPITYSFPSGHTTSSFSAAYVLARQFSIPFFGVPIFLLAGMIAFSRLYLKVHYPTDVLAGSLLGVLCAFLALHIL